jgi:nucleoside-diphosphate-sugar epimerase
MNMDRLNIVIAGCGWLGQQIGAQLLGEGHQVYGTYRSGSTRDRIGSIGIDPVQIGELDQISRTTDLLIISIPPGKPEKVEDYAEYLKNIVLQFPENTKVIFTGSTGVYPKKDGVFKEDYVFENSEKLTPLFLAEKGLRAILLDRLTILRLGGLIGPNRHPVKVLSGREIQTDGNAPVNLIDSRDVVNLISFIIKHHLFGELLNVSFPILMTKNDYYKMIASRLGLEGPRYVGTPESIRLVDSSKLISNLGFSYQFPITDYDSLD